MFIKTLRLFIGSVLFFVCMYFLEGKPKPVTPAAAPVDNLSSRMQNGVDNRSYIPDSITMQHLSGRTSDKNYF